MFLKGIELIGCELVAIEGTKIRGQNRKGNNHTEKDVASYLKYLEEKSEGYLKELDAADKQEAGSSDDLSVREGEVKELLNKIKEKKEKYKML